MAFRSTPQLGPGLEDHADKFYWDMPDVDVSYRLGNVEMGNDGYHYVLVQAGAALDAEDVVTISATWVATADAGGSYQVPADIEGGAVADGEYFHARKVSEGYEDAT